MRVRRGASRFWSFLYSSGAVRARMPFWRVVIEAKLDLRAKTWPEGFDSAVAAVYVWARTIEEAEGLATLAAEEESLEVLTADAMKHPPIGAPRRTPGAVGRSPWGFLPGIDGETEAEGPSHRDARA